MRSICSEPGTQLLVGSGAAQETVTVLSTAAPDTVNLTAAFVNGHNPGDHVVPLFSMKTLAAAAPVGSIVLNLLSRVSLAVGDVLRVGDAPDDEFVSVAATPNRAAAGADPGNVILSSPLVRAHPTGTNARRQNAAAITPIQPTPLVLTASPGSTWLVVSDGTGFVANAVVRVTAGSGDNFFHRLAANAAAATSAAEVQLDRPLDLAHPEGSALVERNPLLDVQALDPGAWGNRLRISVEDERPGSVPRTRLATVVDALHVRLDSASGVEAGTILELLNPLSDDSVVGEPIKVESIDRQANSTITLRAPGLSVAQQSAQTTAIGAGTRLGVRSREFRITVILLHQPDPARPSRNELITDSEMFRYLSLDPRHSRYAPRVIGDIDGALRLVDQRPEGESNYIRIHDPSPSEDVRVGPETLVDLLPSGRWRPARHPLSAIRGDDSLATLNDAVYDRLRQHRPRSPHGSVLANERRRDQHRRCARPDPAGLQSALIDHCENLRYRFAVLDGAAPPADSIADVQNQRQQFDTKYAALYYPWLLIADPFPANLQDIRQRRHPAVGPRARRSTPAPTSSAACTRRRPTRWSAASPACSERSTRASRTSSTRIPSNINVIRDFRPNNRGIRVWGGTRDHQRPGLEVRQRPPAADLHRGLDRPRPAVGGVRAQRRAALGARAAHRSRTSSPLVWRNGALEGTKPEEAFFVKCDRTTMTQADIDNGRLICVIGVAPVKPAEFVIIRIGLWTAHAED